jgi:hypothetical protein
MNNKPLTKSGALLLPFCRYAVIPALMLGIGPRVLAQPSTLSWDTTISFSGSGTLPVNETLGLTGTDPTLGISFSAPAVYTATETDPTDYNINSSFNTKATITMPGGISASSPSFSPSASTAGDPGITLSLPTGASSYDFSPDTAPPFGGPPFYGLYGSDAPLNGTVYSGSIDTALANLIDYTFKYDGFTITNSYNGAMTLTLGTDTETDVGGVYTDTFAGSTLDLTTSLSYHDPAIVFTGDITMTTSLAAPDSSPGLVGILALIGVCAVGAWQKREQAA